MIDLPMDERLAQELAAIAAEDQKMRHEVAKPGGADLPRRMSVAERMRWSRVDVTHADRLGEILTEYGWPGQSLVGEDGDRDAWLLAQHADHDLTTQRRALELLSRAVADGDANPRHEAYLTDRVRMNEGREQLYGTQMADFRDGAAVPWPIEEPDAVDRRRALIGLERSASTSPRLASPIQLAPRPTIPEPTRLPQSRPRGHEPLRLPLLVPVAPEQQRDRDGGRLVSRPVVRDSRSEHAQMERLAGSSMSREAR